MKKTFNKVQAGEFIYTFNPIENQAIPLLVESIHIPQIIDLAKEYVVIRYYGIKPPKQVPGFTLEDLVKRAKEVEVNVPIRTFWAPKNLELCFTSTFPPLIYAVDKENIESWSKKELT
jgi:hypothetical protein